jgi:hypothetical protein
MVYSQQPNFDHDSLSSDTSESFDELFNGIDSKLPEEQPEVIVNPPTEQEVTTYERLVPMLHAAQHEMSELSKKRPDGIVNTLKIRIINRLLVELRKLLENDPSRDFVELLDEETLPQNSDVVLLLSQWQSALAQYRYRYHPSGQKGSSQWVTAENPGSYVVQNEGLS